jgi:hypothetical protein
MKTMGEVHLGAVLSAEAGVDGNADKERIIRNDEVDMFHTVKPAWNTRMQFTKAAATWILGGMKKAGVFPQRPSPDEASAKLVGLLKPVATRPHLPRDPLRAAIKTAWGPGKPGPRSA